MLLAQRGGNHIVQNIGGGNCVFYAHLRTGSITVRSGDQLKAGQIFWQLGNPGHSTGPHLHLEVMDSSDQLRANGLPFVFKTFRVDSQLVSQAALESLLFQTGGPAQLQAGFTANDQHDVIPLQLDDMTIPTGYAVNRPVAQGDSDNNTRRLVMLFGNPMFVGPAESSERGKGVYIPTLLAERLGRL